jgi:hypothetical protein
VATLPYYKTGDYRSYVLTDPNDAAIEDIYLHRGRQYVPLRHGGAGGFIADTAINLVFPKDGDISELREQSPWDTAEAPGHKLRRTAHFLVTRLTRSKTETIVVSGWIVPFDPNRGLPMEDRTTPMGGHYYDWRPYMKGDAPYIREHRLGQIFSSDLVEVGRLCGLRMPSEDHSFLPVLLGFKTLTRFLEDIGVKNYVCAAIDCPRKRYATLYEGMGLRKIRQYEVPTIVGIEVQAGLWQPVMRTLPYFAMHVNVPHTYQRILNMEFGKAAVVGAAKLNKKILSFVVPHLFHPPTGSWQPDHDSFEGV